MSKKQKKITKTIKIYKKNYFDDENKNKNISSNKFVKFDNVFKNN